MWRRAYCPRSKKIHKILGPVVDVTEVIRRLLEVTGRTELILNKVAVTQM